SVRKSGRPTSQIGDRSSRNTIRKSNSRADHSAGTGGVVSLFLSVACVSGAFDSELAGGLLLDEDLRESVA
ncbi:MAG TPA: hypothetical protein VF898_14490, partial [Chloroflexota bacterium]